MVKNGEKSIKSVFIGEQGIKTVMKGDTKLYERPGAFIYLTLDSKK